MLEARILDRIDEISAEAWDGLLGPDGSPFLEHRWLHALEEAGCVTAEDGWLPKHITLYRGSTLVAACPSYVKGNSQGEFVFDWSWADLAHRMGIDYYPKIIVGVPFTPVTGQRILVAEGEDRGLATAMMADALKEWSKAIEASSVHLLFAQEEETRAFCRRGFEERLGFQFQWFNQGYTSWDDFLSRFNAKHRHQIKREVAQPAKDGVRIETLAPDAITPALTDAMFGFYASTVDKFFYGHRYLNPKFFELVTARFADRLAWVMAWKDDAPIAGAFNVTKGKRLYGRYWGAKAELPFLHFNVCYYHGIKECIARGLEAFEPGAGGEHKVARGFVPTTTRSAHFIANERLGKVVKGFLGREREAVQRHVASGRADGPLKMSE